LLLHYLWHKAFMDGKNFLEIFYGRRHAGVVPTRHGWTDIILFGTNFYLLLVISDWPNSLLRQICN
jgi:hypothetical protein